MSRTPQFGERQPTSEAASKVMQGNRSKDTKPEVLLRKTLWHRGRRYRVNYRGLPGNPDIVFMAEKVAVFCDGDFWHGRNWQERRPRLAQGANGDYWVEKIGANRKRDRRQTDALEASGWTVIRLWGTDIKEDPEHAADHVEKVLDNQAE